MANVAVLGQMQNMVLNQLQMIQKQQQQQQQQQMNATLQTPDNQNNINNNGVNVNNGQNNNEPGNGMISLLFKRTTPNKNLDFQITIICSPNDTIGHVIDKYLSKSLEKKKDVIFLFNTTELGNIPNETVHSLCLINQSIIMVVNKKDATGGI